jgi:hypothetical protein
VGHLFQGRYKGIVVEADEYAKELSRYIHLNPVRAGAVVSPADYQWSSYAEYIGKRNPPAWLARNFILAYFGSKETKAQRRYQDFVEAGMENSTNPLSEVVGSLLLGSESFIQAIRENYLEARKADRDLPAVRRCEARTTPEDIEQVVDRAFRKDPRMARKVKLYLYHSYTAQNLKEIGVRFGIGESGVSQASRRMKETMNRDPGLRKRINAVTAELGL